MVCSRYCKTSADSLWIISAYKRQVYGWCIRLQINDLHMITFTCLQPCHSLTWLTSPWWVIVGPFLIRVFTLTKEETVRISKCLHQPQYCSVAGVTVKTTNTFGCCFIREVSSCGVQQASFGRSLWLFCQGACQTPAKIKSIVYSSDSQSVGIVWILN